MYRNFRNFFTTLGLTAALAFAQGGPHNGPQPTAQANAGLNMAQVKTVEGAITAVQIAYGAQYPSIVVNRTQIKLAPAWYLLENDFELTTGVAVRVTVAPSNTANDPYLYAIEITKTTTNARITLRDAQGIPLWIGAASHGGNPQAPHNGGTCVDAASIKTATGVIDRVTVAAGIQHPSLVLNINGALLTIELGPERMLFDRDFELKPGATVTVKYAVSTCDDENIALAITDAAGHTVVLRNDDCTPSWHD